MRLMLLSNSTNPASDYLEHASTAINEFLTGIEEVTFIPYASVDHDGYTESARQGFAAFGKKLHGIHRDGDPQQTLNQARAVFVGGGNTFLLVKTLRAMGLLEPLSELASAGVPYLGASAGTVIAGPSLRTTNDMPIVNPGGFATLSLVPFQINPHYLDADPSSLHMGETRDQRIAEFLEQEDVPVIGIREGCWLEVDGTKGRLAGVATNGSGPAKVFRRHSAPAEVHDDISDLLLVSDE